MQLDIGIFFVSLKDNTIPPEHHFKSKMTIFEIKLFLISIGKGHLNDKCLLIISLNISIMQLLFS